MTKCSRHDASWTQGGKFWRFIGSGDLVYQPIHAMIDRGTTSARCACGAVVSRPDVPMVAPEPRTLAEYHDRGWTRAEFASKVLPGKDPPQTLASTPGAKPNPFYDLPTSQDVLAVAVGTQYRGSREVNPGQVTYGRAKLDGGLTFLADLKRFWRGYVTVTVLNRNGDVLTSHHCTECGAGDGALHRGGEECPGLRKMRHAAGLRLEPPGTSAIAHVKETRLRPYKSELAVVMVDDMSEPP